MGRDANMSSRLSAFVFCVECFFLLLFGLTSVPMPWLHSSFIQPSPSLLTFIVFGGYCWLALGFAFYVYGVAIAAMGRTSTFWRSFIPPILGVPVVIWGLGKLQTTANMAVAVAVLLVAVLLSAAVAARTPATKWRAVPALLLVGFFATADVAMLGWVNVFIGSALLTVPLFLFWIERS